MTTHIILFDCGYVNMLSLSFYECTVLVTHTTAATSFIQRNGKFSSLQTLPPVRLVTAEELLSMAIELKTHNGYRLALVVLTKIPTTFK